jgi:comEA protein
MFLNRKEQIAALVLCGTLCVGAAVSYYKNRYPDRVEDFGVVKAAVQPPGALAGVPEKADTPSAAPDTVRVRGLDLNRAGAGDLEGLPRIGPVMARRIVEYRTQHGPFRRVDDLKKVKGIGEKTLEQLRPLVKVENPNPSPGIPTRGVEKAAPPSRIGKGDGGLGL